MQGRAGLMGHSALAAPYSVPIHFIQHCLFPNHNRMSFVF